MLAVLTHSTYGAASKKAPAASTKTPTPTKNMFLIGFDKPLKEYPFPKLPFAYKALEPLIDAETMKIHHSVLLKNYTADLNEFMTKWKKSAAAGEEKKLAEGSLLNVWRNEAKIPDAQKEKFFQHAGGYLNHLLYFATMSPPAAAVAKKPVTTFPATFQNVVDRSFHNVTDMKDRMAEMIDDEMFGSGWVYLVRAGGYSDGDYLTLMVSRDEMMPLQSTRIMPVLACDLWEHAFLKKYGLKRREYFDNWWKTIDWVKVEEVFNWWRKVDGYSEKKLEL